MKPAALLLTYLLAIALGFLLSGNLTRGLAQPAKNPETEPSLKMLGSITGEKFTLQKVIAETSGSQVLKPNPSHQPLLDFIQETASTVSILLSQPDSPAREKRRINEVSALFEDALREQLNTHPDFTCDFPKTKSGETQRSGYPDLRVEHLPTGNIAYLDPKLFEDKSIKSSFRTFYYEPGGKNTKVNEDAIHLLIGFPHDGKTREWTFGTPKLVDLSDLTVKLKAEFSASNKDVYQKEHLLKPR